MRIRGKGAEVGRFHLLNHDLNDAELLERVGSMNLQRRHDGGQGQSGNLC